MSTEVDHPVTERTLDLGAEARKAWGPKWSAPEVEYEWSNGRKHVRQTEDCAIYSTSPDH